MPPWLDSADEVAAIATAVVVAVGAVVAALTTAAGGVLIVAVKLYRSQIKPMLSGTQQAAQQAAHELRANSGTSTRDAINRTETTIDRIAADLRDMRAEQRVDRDAGNRAHSEIFRRLRRIETPLEDTRP